MSEEWYEEAYFNRKFTFRFGDCDKSKNASLYAVMKLLSELAGDDYERRELGYEYLLQNGQAMLLSRMRLKFARVPSHSEKIVASTWERLVKGPYFYREYEIKSESGDVLVSGSSQWMLVDITSRVVLRPSSLVKGRRQENPRKSDCLDCEKLKKNEGLSPLGGRPIYYTDLDGNGHVNNAVYGKIAVDFLPEEIRQKGIKDFSINFFMETKQDETLEICGKEIDNGYLLQGISNNTLRFGCEFIC